MGSWRLVQLIDIEGNLNNPGLFTGKHYNVIHLARDYLNICVQHPNSALVHEAKSHLFKLFHKVLPLHVDVRETLTKVKSWQDLTQVVDQLAVRMPSDIPTFLESPFPPGIRVLPEWIAQPNIRPDPDLAMAKDAGDVVNPAQRKTVPADRPPKKIKPIGLIHKSRCQGYTQGW